MNNGLFSAVIAAVCLAGYLVLNKKAGVDPTIGTAVVRAAGFATAILILAMFAVREGISLSSISHSGLLYVVAAGVLIAVGDLFMFRAFTSGLPVSVAGPVISGGAVVFAALGGIFLLGETVTFTKILGIGAATIAAILLSL